MEKVIMIGGNSPEMAKDVLEAIKEKADGATIFELTPEEMKMVTENRILKSNSDALRDYIGNDENKKQAKVIAIEFHKRLFEGKEKDIFFEKTGVKKLTNFSWSKFNEVLATLDMFGFIEWMNDDKKSFRIIISDEEIYENKKKEAQSLLDLCKGKLIELQDITKLKKDKDKIETIKKKLILTV